MSSTDNTHQVEYLRELGALELVPVGTRVLVYEDGITYIGLGNALPSIIQRTGWTQSNVWMPAHVYTYVLTKRSRIFPDPARLAAAVLTGPVSVHHDMHRKDAFYFFADASRMRDQGLLASSSARYVDAAVELRQVPGGSVLRLFHLSPRDQNQGGEQLWP